MVRPSSPIRSNVVDRVVTYFAPQAGARRFAARLALFGVGGYSGARTDRAALKDWDPRTDSADSASVPDLKRLRARARDLARNNPLAGGAINTVVDNVVGTGLLPIPQPDADYLGLTQEQAADWAERAERIFWAHCGDASIDIARTLDFCAQTRLATRSEHESGDVLVIRRFVPRKGDLLATRVQLVEADRISTPDGKQTAENIVEGVEVDQHGAPVAYHVSDFHPGDPLTGTATRVRKWKRVVAFGPSGNRVAVHLHTLLRPGQTRGIPMLASVIEPLKQLGRFTDAELMASVVNGMLAFSVETTTGDDAPRYAGAQVGETDGSSEEDLRLDYGAIMNLAPGEKLNMHAPNRPNTAFDAFVLSVLRQVGAGLGIPFEVLVMHFTKSYSASRAAWMLAWKTFGVKRDHVAWGFCHTVYGWVIEEAIARGLLAAPGFFTDPLARKAWLGCDWRGAPAGQMDPLKEIQAVKMRRDLRISTLAQDTAETTGGDWRANLQQIAAEHAEMRRLGIDPATEAVGERVVSESSTQTTQTTTEESDEGEEVDE